MTGIMTENDKDLVKFHTTLIMYRFYFSLLYIMIRKAIDEHIVYNLDINDCHQVLG